jgi:hypothetical protein
MRAFFMSKVSSLVELEELTQEAISSGDEGNEYEVVREVILNENEFGLFADNILSDWDWIESYAGGRNYGATRCQDSYFSIVKV